MGEGAVPAMCNLLDCKDSTVRDRGRVGESDSLESSQSVLNESFSGDESILALGTI